MPIVAGTTSTYGQGGPQLIASVCQTVRQGAPAALRPPFTAAGISHYLTGAQPVARRVDVSLRRIARSGSSARLHLLVQELGQLRLAYRTAPVLLHGPGGAAAAGRQIVVREGAVSAAARNAGYPSCSVG